MIALLHPLGSRNKALGRQQRLHQGSNRVLGIFATLLSQGPHNPLPPAASTGWFWFSFHFPSIFSISMRKPTICARSRLTNVSESLPSDQGWGMALLVVPHRFPHDVQQGSLVVDDFGPAIGVDRDIVPGGYDVFGFVPGGRDVGVRAREDRQCRLPVDLSPLRIGPGHVADQRAVRPVGSFEKEGQVGGRTRSSSTLRHEQAEAVAFDEVVQPGQVGLGEGSGNIHGELLVSRASCSASHLPRFDTARTLAARDRVIQIA